MDINHFIDELFAEANRQNVKEYQAVYLRQESSNLQVFEQKVSKQSNSVSMSLTFAVRIGTKIGRFVTENFDANEVASIVSEAIDNAKILECEENFFFYDGHGIYKEVNPYCPIRQKLESLDKIAYLKELESKAYAADKRIKKVIYTSFSQSSYHRIIRNSLGLNLYNADEFSGAYVYLSATDDKSVKSHGYSVTFNKDEDFDTDYVVNKAVVKALSHLNAIDVKSQKTAVIFENKIFAEFLEAIKSIFDAYQIDTGRSKLKDKIGELVASPKLSLIDNPWLDGGYKTSSFDSEGVPTRCKDVIRNGVLQTYLYGQCMADKHHCETTGNGTGGMSAQTFNFYIENGSLSLDELLKELNNGVYIDKISGLRVAMNIVTGDVSASAEGYLVENGQITKPLNQFTFACNIYEMLKDIRELGNDLIFYCSPHGSPSVLVDNIMIAGD